MRKPLRWAAMSLVVLAGFQVVALAQFRGGGPGGGGGGFGGPASVLQDENVKRELGLVEEQIQKIQAINERSQAEVREMFSGLRDLSEDARRARFDELREKMTARNEDVQRAINEVLLPQQVERLKQITVQNQLRRSGTAEAITEGALATELGLTDADKERIRKAAESAEAKKKKKTEQLREEARQEIIAALSPAQQAKFKQLMGTPIQFSPPQFGRGAPGGGGFGGNTGGFGRNRGGDRGGGTQLRRPADGD